MLGVFAIGGGSAICYRGGSGLFVAGALCGWGGINGDFARCLGAIFQVGALCVLRLTA